MPSKTLAEALADMEGHPWAEYGRQHKPITQHALARLLADFNITPGTIRISDRDTPKGYKREQFADVWERYPSPDSPDQPPRRHTARKIRLLRRIRKRHARSKVADTKPPETPVRLLIVAVWRVKMPFTVIRSRENRAIPSVLRFMQHD